MSYRSASSRAAAFDDALREAMGSSVTERFDVEGAPASDPSAGTPRPKGVAVDAVTADSAVTDPRPKSYDGDRVKHGTSVNPQEIWNKRVRFGGERYMAAENAERERNRRARLRRWQETRG